MVVICKFYETLNVYIYVSLIKSVDDMEIFCRQVFRVGRHDGRNFSVSGTGAESVARVSRQSTGENRTKLLALCLGL